MTVEIVRFRNGNHWTEFIECTSVDFDHEEDENGTRVLIMLHDELLTTVPIHSLRSVVSN